MDPGLQIVRGPAGQLGQSVPRLVEIFQGCRKESDGNVKKSNRKLKNAKLISALKIVSGDLGMSGRAVHNLVEPVKGQGRERSTKQKPMRVFFFSSTIALWKIMTESSLIL